jgi:hypothetical protein
MHQRQPQARLLQSTTTVRSQKEEDRSTSALFDRGKSTEDERWLDASVIEDGLEAGFDLNNGNLFSIIKHLTDGIQLDSSIPFSNRGDNGSLHDKDNVNGSLHDKDNVNGSLHDKDNVTGSLLDKDIVNDSLDLNGNLDDSLHFNESILLDIFNGMVENGPEIDGLINQLLLTKDGLEDEATLFLRTEEPIRSNNTNLERISFENSNVSDTLRSDQLSENIMSDITEGDSRLTDMIRQLFKEEELGSPVDIGLGEAAETVLEAPDGSSLVHMIQQLLRDENEKNDMSNITDTKLIKENTNQTVEVRNSSWLGNLTFWKGLESGSDNSTIEEKSGLMEAIKRLFITERLVVMNPAEEGLNSNSSSSNSSSSTSSSNSFLARIFSRLMPVTDTNFLEAPPDDTEVVFSETFAEDGGENFDTNGDVSDDSSKVSFSQAEDDEELKSSVVNLSPHQREKVGKNLLHLKGQYCENFEPGFLPVIPT